MSATTSSSFSVLASLSLWVVGLFWVSSFRACFVDRFGACLLVWEHDDFGFGYCSRNKASMSSPAGLFWPTIWFSSDTFLSSNFGVVSFLTMGSGRTGVDRISFLG